MDFIDNISLGFLVAISPANLFYVFIGTLLGTLIGVLPGIGPLATISMLLPITYHLDPTGALIMLAGIYYGAQYGGSTTAILVNLPGELASVVTCLDGYQMARNGRAGPALAIAALASFFAGCVATLIVAVLSPVLAEVALRFGPADFFALMVVGLLTATVLAQGSQLKAIGMILVGLLIGLVGVDVNSGALRFTFGVLELSDGVDFIIVAMGMFGLAEIIVNLEQGSERSVARFKIGSLYPTKDDLRKTWAPTIRGTTLGSVLGILPGGGAALSSFASYALEKKLSKTPEQFGRGDPAGVASPEAANNAAAQTSFIPMLTLGIPSNAIMAVMIGALMIHGIVPGPEVMSSKPELFWGLIVSMWLGNAVLVALNLPLIGLWTTLLKVPYRLLFPMILFFIAVGVLSLTNRPIDGLLLAVFGLLGYVFVKLDCEPAPLLLGFILGPMMEEYLRRALVISRGDPLVFVREPLSAALLAVAVVFVLMVLWQLLQKYQRQGQG